MITVKCKQITSNTSIINQSINPSKTSSSFLYGQHDGLTIPCHIKFNGSSAIGNTTRFRSTGKVTSMDTGSVDFFHNDLSMFILRAAATTLQPALAKSIQSCRPSPDDAPVITTTLPCKLLHGSIFFKASLAISFSSKTK